MLKKIVVPIDFSDESQRAAKEAVEWAQKFGASLTFVHVVPFDVSAMYPSHIQDFQATQLSMGKEELEKFVENLKVPSSIKHEKKTLIGLPDDVIVEEAKSSNADLIMMSSHGRTGFKHFILGSVAERVVRAATCHVLVLKKNG